MPVCIDDKKLRALELNSWQLLRLLQAQLPGVSCNEVSGISKCNGSLEKMFCCLYMNAAFLHNSWMSKDGSRWVCDTIYCVKHHTRF